MFFLWYIASLLFIINSCLNEQLCINSCSFDHKFDSNLSLPPTCTFIRRDQCNAILTFDYSTRIVNIQFGSLSHKQQRDDNNDEYTSQLISHTIITLDDDSSTQHIVEYFCSTDDHCEYEFVRNQALSMYIHKTCHHLRAHLISLLHSDPSSSSRSCVSPDGSISVCNQPCDLFFVNPNQIVHSCNGQRNLAFETTVGRSTPTNNPEYDYRLYAYACTTELCNGIEKQKEIEKLIKLDDGECLIFFDNENQTTTTPNYHNQAISYSKSFILFIICFLILFQ